MNYYIIKNSDGELVIMKVRFDQEASFLEDYQGMILVCGSSMAEALIRFDELAG